MNFDYQKVWESKQVQREKLAALPLGEKFRILDRLAESAQAIRASQPAMSQAVSAGNAGPSRWAQRKLLPEYEALLNSGSLTSTVDSTPGLSEERDAR